MTWKSHCVANGAVTLALTSRFDVALAAMATAALPDQIESTLPLGKHRGASHWVLLWVIIMIAGPVYLRCDWTHWNVAWHSKVLRELQSALRTAAYGLALGPLLHVLLDGCSSAGVPVAPFSRMRLRLALYKTANRRASFNLSELAFLIAVLAGCALSWRAVSWPSFTFQAFHG